MPALLPLTPDPTEYWATYALKLIPFNSHNSLFNDLLSNVSQLKLHCVHFRITHFHLFFDSFVWFERHHNLEVLEQLSIASDFQLFSSFCECQNCNNFGIDWLLACAACQVGKAENAPSFDDKLIFTFCYFVAFSRMPFTAPTGIMF